MLQPYPQRTSFRAMQRAERAIAPVKAAILGARQIRGQLDVPRSRQCRSTTSRPHEDDAGDHLTASMT